MTSKSFPCVACPTEIFESRIELSRHYSEAHKNLKIPCPQCRKKISTIGDLRKHLKIHDPNRSRGFKCIGDQCDKSFHTATGAKLHFARAHSKDKPFPCPLQCGKLFKAKHEVNPHILSHTKEKPYKCNQCRRSFGRNANFIQHVKLQHTFPDAKPHECSQCGKTFKRRHHLKHHIQSIHTSRTRDYFCLVCPSKFFSKDDLTRHSVTHECERKLVDCYFCPKRSTRLSNLEIHLRIHTTEKPFSCPEIRCNFSSSHASALRSHVRNYHQQSPRRMEHTCYFCMAAFKRNTHITEHTRIHTLEKPYFCKFCRKSVNQLCNLIRHIHQIHTKEKPYKCNHCEKCFCSKAELENHTSIHTKEKRFFCEICSYSSYFFGKLKEHLRRRHKASEPLESYQGQVHVQLLHQVQL